MDLRVHGIEPAILRQAKARAEAAGESLSAVVRRLVARYAQAGDSAASGGRARAEALSPDRRREIAQQAAAARWQRTTHD